MYIDSTVLTTRRTDGRIIRSVVEGPATATSETPLVLLVPPFGRTMRDLFTASLCMVGNGFRTWRFDHTNHVGASDGEIFDFTLSSAMEDLQLVLQELRRYYPTAPLGLLTSSLGSRVAFRTLKGRYDIAAVVSLVGVVHVQHTLSRVVGRDLVDEVLRGLPIPATAMAFEYEVSTRFIHDVVNGGWHSLESARTDVAACPFPIVQILGELDGWTLPHEVAQAFNQALSPPRAIYVLPGASHKLEHNPSAARDALRHAAMVMKEHIQRTGDPGGQAAVPHYPGFREIVNKNRHERQLEKECYPDGYHVVVHLAEAPADLPGEFAVVPVVVAADARGVAADRALARTLEESP